MVLKIILHNVNVSFYSTADAKKNGVSILVKDSVAFQLVTSTIDVKGRYIILHCVLISRKYTLLSLYAPNSGQLSFIKKTITKAKEHRVGDLVICGDFNLVMDKTLDRSPGANRCAQDLQSFANEEELHDVWRYVHSTERDYMFYSNPNKTYSRIYLFFW